MKRLPILPTLIVGVAVAIMVSLGLWQIGRATEKETLLASYRSAASGPSEAVPLPRPGTPVDRLPLFRRTSAICAVPSPSRVVAGRNRQGQSGFVHWVECNEGAFRADVGWSSRPGSVQWGGGPIEGIVAPDRERGFRLIADRGVTGLQPSAPPDIEAIPNNHRSYAFQWFAFAAAALIIYGLALRRRA